MNFKPKTIQITGTSTLPSEEICELILDVSLWSSFKGCGPLPGIRSAFYDVRFPSIVHSKISVQNTDGSMHIEEIIEWDPQRRIVFLLKDFTSVLKNFATHFVEVWEFERKAEITHIKRTIAMYPSGILGSLLLIPISALMKKALEKNIKEITAQKTKL